MAAAASTPGVPVSPGELDENSANLFKHIDKEFTNFEDILRRDWRTLERDSVPLVGQNSKVDGPIEPYTLDDMLIDPLDGTEQPKRNLRPQQSTKRFRDPCYDLDDSGDYDPAEPERLSRQRLKRNKSRKRVIRTSGSDEFCSDETATEEQHSCHTNRHCSQDAERFRVVLRVNSEQGKRRLKELLLLSANPADFDLKGYALRRRAPGDIATNTTSKDERSNLSGHPIARGCHKCAELHDECSLLYDETSWPCYHCQAAGNDCRLITSPKRSKACKSCRGRRVPCSYTYTRNHGSSCQQCVATGLPCVAGPAKDFIKLRARYPAPEEQSETADDLVKALSLSLQRIKKSHSKNRRRKVPEDCLECSAESRRCQYQLGDIGQYDSAGCISCHDNGLPCTVREKLPSALVDDSPKTDNHAKVSASEGRKDVEGEEEPSEWPSAIQPKVVIRKIETSFTYPIYFNCDDAEHSANVRDCLFCTSPEAAIYGFGLRQTHIEDHQDRRRCEEVSRRMRPTSLCTLCTTTRMNILVCEKHDMRPIVGVYKQKGAACDEEVDVHHVEDLKGICAICPLRAVYECASEKSSTEDGNGCGLRLCEPCALKVEMEHDGNLQHALPSLPSTMGDMLQLRADCELLRDDGALQRYFRWLSISPLAVSTSF